MLTRKHTEIALLLLLQLMLPAPNTALQAQADQRNYSLNGHLQDMQTLWIPDGSSRWQSMNQIKNRLDLRWYPSPAFSLHLGMRNNFSFGMMPQLYYPFMADMAVSDPGYLDMTWLVAKDTSYFMTANFDRALITYTTGGFRATLGRQRINWGINSVWNPNDIFNTFDYFDFDYVERPGCDAVHLQYYTSATSSAEAALKLDSKGRITMAAMYRFNSKGYDFQFLGGYMAGDYLLGAGWSGQIGGAGFSGEMSYFRPGESFADSSGTFTGSMGANYTFGNSLMLQFEGLYNSAGTSGPAGMGTALFVSREVSAKSFTLARWSLFGNASYPLTPLVNLSMAAIFNPTDHSVFAGPTADISLTGNISFLLTAQLFFGEDGTEFGGYGKLAFARIKWDF
jgi:hypothetical protein